MVLMSYSNGNGYRTMTRYLNHTITEFLWEIKNLGISILFPDWLNDVNSASYNNWIFMWIKIWYIFEHLVYDMSIKSAVLAIHISLAGSIYEATQMSKKNYSNWMLIFRKPFFRYLIFLEPYSFWNLQKHIKEKLFILNIPEHFLETSYSFWKLQKHIKENC